MNSKNNEVWNSVKRKSMDNKINPYDAYIFIFEHINKIETLLSRRLKVKEIKETINQAVEYIFSE